MKTLFTIAIVGTILLSSCRKGYSCYCSNADGDVVTQTLSGRITKANAQKQCNTMQFLYSEDEFTCTAKEI
jgi:hypothetical protein